MLESATRAGLHGRHKRLEAAYIDVAARTAGESTLDSLRKLLNDSELSARELAWANLLLAEVQLRLGREIAATTALRRALKGKSPAADAEFHYRAGRLLLALDRYTEALAEATKASYLSPRAPRHVALLERIRRARAKSTTALSELERKVQDDPRSEEARKELHHILRQITRICQQLKDPLVGCPRVGL